MFKRIRKRLNWQGRKARAAVAVAICVGALGIGVGSGTLLAQLGGGNPTPNTEATSCYIEVGCTYPDGGTEFQCLSGGPGGGEASSLGSYAYNGSTCGWLNGNTGPIPCPEVEISPAKPCLR